MSFSTIFLLAGAAAMSHGVAPVGSGVVVAAPHEGFDDHTKPMAKAIAEELECGWVVAENYRAPQDGRWLDVNRPTQRLPGADGRLAKGKETKQGRKTYTKYQRLLLKAGKRKGGPLDLLVEIHGHARQAREVGKVQVIELATRGFSEQELKDLDRRYRRLVREELPKEDRVTLAVEQLHPSYEYGGYTFGFYFRASVAKKKGSLSPERTQRALHFELPQKVRFDPKRRAAYARVLARLLAPLR